MLKEKLGIDAELQVGRPGVYEVSVDGKVVAGRERFGFPTEDEIVSRVQQALGR